MPSSGSQTGRLQKWRPTFKTLITDLVAETSGRATQTFRIPIPDSRLRVKISVLFAFAAGQQPSNPALIDLSPANAKLWIYETEDDDSGTTGSSYGATNIEGTEAAPTVIPATVGLSGYSREFETAADNIEAVFSAASTGFAGNWILQIRIQPTTGQRFSKEEWDELVGQFKPIVPPAVPVPAV